ncbi:13990_t:CDS:1, partial [Cetraspora pellucida]
KELEKNSGNLDVDIIAALMLRKMNTKPANIIRRPLNQAIVKDYFGL